MYGGNIISEFNDDNPAITANHNDFFGSIKQYVRLIIVLEKRRNKKKIYSKNEGVVEVDIKDKHFILTILDYFLSKDQESVTAPPFAKSH